MKTALEQETAFHVDPIPGWLVRKMNRMTLLVGIVGTDGIVLATDQRVIKPAQNDSVMDDTFGICKIVDLPNSKVAYACAGDYMATLVGRELERVLEKEEFDFSNVARSLRELTIRTCGEEEQASNVFFNPEVHRALLIVFYRDQPQLWRLDVRSRNPDAFQIRDMAIAGAAGNAARFFSTYFERELSAKSLTLLAAHLVLTAGRIDPLMVSGLDVAIITAKECTALTGPEKDALRERSKRIDSSIRDLVLFLGSGK